MAPNLVARQFEATDPNRTRMTDVTAIWTVDGWLYLAVLLDPHSRRVLAWAVSETKYTAWTLRALQRGLRARPPAFVLMHHSDRGSPYAAQVVRVSNTTCAPLTGRLSRAMASRLHEPQRRPLRQRDR